jgi:hypothetical protein
MPLPVGLAVFAGCQSARRVATKPAGVLGGVPDVNHPENLIGFRSRTLVDER